MKILIGIGVVLLIQLWALALCGANGRRKEEDDAQEDWFKHGDEVDE